MKLYLHMHEEVIKVPKFEEASGFYTTRQRSKIMSRIRGQDTTPEKKIKKALWAAGVRYKRSNKSLMGKPDIQLLRYNIVIFIDGDFWHGFDWENRRHKINSNKNFWIPKIERNMQRDKQVNAALSQQGFIVLRFWEHEIKNEFGKCLLHILNEINAQKDKLYLIDNDAHEL
ncbi:MAG TPA: very short patch repair endonuclease [Cytophagales bacterium]|nr:very short patch repair endonuclease [Cytophagales bacterium]